MKENERITSGIYFEGMTSIRSVLRGFDIGINNRRIEKLFIDSNSLKSKVSNCLR